MISDAERTALRTASLSQWDRVKGTHGHRLHERAMDAQANAQTAISRANRAIERALREVALSRERRSASSRPKVIVADGRIAERVLISHALRSDRRVEVVTDAVDGAEALATSIVHQPDVIVLDDRLPELAGLDVAAELRLYAPRTRSVLLVDQHDPLYLNRPSVVDAIAPRYGDRHGLVELIVRLAS